MRIVYIGLVDFSYHCLIEVIKNKGNVVGIVTSKNDKNNTDYKDLTLIAAENSIPIFYCKNINSIETLDWIKKCNPDIIFCWGWSQIIRKDLLASSSMGIIGTHPSLLPLNRGRHPIIWSLFLGLKETGLTFFFIDEGVDSGPILSQKLIKIEPFDTAATLYEKIKQSAALQIKEFLPKLINNNYTKFSQDQKITNYWRKRSSKDGFIDWRMNGNAIINLIRSLTKPYPGAQFKYRDTTITAWKANIVSDISILNLEPGKIIKINDSGLIIKCYDCSIFIEEYEPETLFIEGDYVE